MKLFKAVFLVLLMISVNVQGAKWQKLKSLKEYPASAYTLKEGVEYLEIRNYIKGNKDMRYNIKSMASQFLCKVISEYDNSIMNFGECGHFTYRININKKGKIIGKKLLKKKPSKNGCLAMD